MAQDVHIVDLRRSYIPQDPNAFPATMHATQAEDTPERGVPVLPYDGYNFMPTPQGYCSFFGVNSTLQLDALAAKVDDIFMIQTPQFQNILVALAEDGIWTKDGGVSGAWTKIVPLTVPASGLHKNWSKCVIDNTIYVYRQGEAYVWEASPTNGYAFAPFTPSFLNMAGQLGIFKAGGRLGFWDSENSTSWSALSDKHDLTPAIETFAGNSIFQDIVGKIVVVLQHGTGFIIYCTKSIVKVSRNPDSAMLWSAKAIFNNNGIAYREEACFAEPDTTHFAFTAEGIVELGADGSAQFIVPEISTYLKERRRPMYLKVLNGRYLFIPILDDEYLKGRVTFLSETIEGAIYTWNKAKRTVEGEETTRNPCRAVLAAMRSFDQVYLNTQFGYTSYPQAGGAGQVPIWQDNFAITVPIADLTAWKTHDPTAVFGTDDYFVDTGFTNGAIPKISGGNEFIIPTKGPQLAAGFAAINYEANNDNLFFHKQDWLWWSEERFFDHWKKAIDAKVHAPITVGYGDFIDSRSSKILSQNDYEFGPYVMPTFFSEANRQYGTALKSAWLQRSLTRGISVQIRETQYISPLAEQKWRGGGIQAPYYTYEQVKALFPGEVIASKDAGDPASAPHSVSSIVEQTGVGSGASQRRAFIVNVIQSDGDSAGFVEANPWTDGGEQITGSPEKPLQAYLPVYSTQRTQTFAIPTFKYTEFPTCTYKELGFTEIIGHGHYTPLSAFVQDDAIPEAPDYVDICTTNPKGGAPILLNDDPIVPPWTNGTTCGRSFTTTINGSVYTYPAEDPIQIPDAEILLQKGSIEPIYPTFVGAFVYDIHYKKWGKMKQNFKQLLDYLPINNVAGDQVIPYNTFNPKVSALLESGKVAVFDQFPADSEIVFGKIGYYRKGFTDLEEVRVTHRRRYTGWIQVECSLDGRNIEQSMGLIRAFSDKNEIVEGFSLSARWYNIVLRGNFDLTHLETRGYRTGRR